MKFVKNPNEIHSPKKKNISPNRYEPSKNYLFNGRFDHNSSTNERMINSFPVGNERILFSKLAPLPIDTLVKNAITPPAKSRIYPPRFLTTTYRVTTLAPFCPRASKIT